MSLLRGPWTKVRPASRRGFLTAVAILEHIDEPGHDLVDRVIRRPDRADGLDAVEERLREGAKVARRTDGLLTLGQGRDDGVGLGLDAHVSRARVHQGRGR